MAFSRRRDTKSERVRRDAARRDAAAFYRILRRVFRFVPPLARPPRRAGIARAQRPRARISIFRSFISPLLSTAACSRKLRHVERRNSKVERSLSGRARVTSRRSRAEMCLVVAGLRDVRIDGGKKRRSKIQQRCLARAESRALRFCITRSYEVLTARTAPSSKNKTTRGSTRRAGSIPL